MKKTLLASIFFLFAFGATTIAQSWTPKALFDTVPATGISGASINGLVYVIGGIDSTGHNVLRAFNPFANTYTACQHYPGAGRNGMAYFVINGILYAGGGTSGPNTAHADWNKYNPQTDMWDSIAACPAEVRSYASGFEHNGKGYVMCGYNDVLHHTLSDVWEYNPLINMWDSLTALPSAITPRYGMITFNFAGSTYCGLGVDSFGVMRKDLFKFNVDNISATFHFITNLDGDGRLLAVAFVLGETAFIGSGTSGCAWYADFYALSLLDDTTQTPIDPIPFPRAGALGVACNGKGYVISGQTANLLPTADVEELSPNVTTGIGASQTAQITCFPNPFTDSFSVTGIEGGDVVVMDIAGRVVLRERVTEALQVIHCEALSAGIYSIEILNDGKIIYHQKMIKK